MPISKIKVQSQNESIRIAVTSATFSSTPELVSALKEKYAHVKINSPARKMRDDELVEFLADCQAAIIGTEVVDRKVLQKSPQLKAIAKYGVGLDSLDLDCMRERGIPLGWIGGVNRRSVSELTLAFFLGLARNVFFSGFDLKGGAWNKHGGFELTGKTVGLIGCGFIGEDVLRLLQPFQCEVLICDILDKSQQAKVYGAKLASFDEILERSDFVSLHVPLTAATKNMIAAPQLKRMRDTAYLVNTARGELVEQQALKAALQTGEIQGAALDVFQEEPPTDLEFLSLPNLMVTPHIGGNAAEAVKAMGYAAIAGLDKSVAEAGLA
ncbi:MAG: phosphoglycerate dehydrogenase [bacterium]|nr:phosphoglycerate dehydrogenase [bacterium]